MQTSYTKPLFVRVGDKLIEDNEHWFCVWKIVSDEARHTYTFYGIQEDGKFGIRQVPAGLGGIVQRSPYNAERLVSVSIVDGSPLPDTGKQCREHRKEMNLSEEGEAKVNAAGTITVNS